MDAAYQEHIKPQVAVAKTFNVLDDGSMQNIPEVKCGGRRVGAGRPKGSGRYGEPTVAVRVPARIADEVKALIRKAPRKLPLIVVGKPSEAPMSGNA